MKQRKYFSTPLIKNNNPIFNILRKRGFMLSILLLLLFDASGILAQKLTFIRGNVAGIDKVNIWIYETKYGTTTDEQGYYELSVYLSNNIPVRTISNFNKKYF